MTRDIINKKKIGSHAIRFSIWISNLETFAYGIRIRDGKRYEIHRNVRSSEEYDGALNDLWEIYCKIFIID